MARLVTQEDIDLAAPRSVSVSSTAIELSPTRLGRTRRLSFSIVPLTLNTSVTVVKGELNASVVQNAGTVLQQYQPMVESDGDNYNCWQGPICVVASGNGTIAVTEVFENPGATQ